MKTAPKGTIHLLRFFVKSYPKESLLVILSLILAGLAETLGIGALLPLITIIVEGTDTPDNALSDVIFNLYDYINLQPSLINLLITIVLAICLKAIIIFQAMRFVTYVATDVTRDFRLRLIKALMNARWNYFTSLSIGKISNTVSHEAARAGHCYMLGSRTLAAFIQTIIYAMAAFLISWHVSFVAISMAVLIAFCAKGFIRMARNAGSDLTSNMNNMVAELNNSLTGIKPLKAMGQEKRYFDKLDIHTTHVMRAQKKLSLANLLLQIIYEPLAVIILAAGLFYVLSFTETPVESVLLLAFLFYRMITQANLLQSFYQNMVQNEAAVWGIIEETEKAQQKEEKLEGGITPIFSNKISIDNISLYYDRENPVFNNFSAEIPKSKMTALYGPSGTGKTSLIDVILGLSHPQKGDVRIDDCPLDQIDQKKWRNKIGYVPQETFIFHDTIYQNVTMGDESYSKDDVIAALTKADAINFVHQLPESIDSIAGERGGKLSGGQRQRLALARALIRNPEILVLDEATSGLDKKSEEQILDTLQKISQTMTIIIISHDPKILNIADHVIRLDKTEK